MQFNEIIGHDETKQTLIRAVQNNHVAHALLFDGPPGSATLALALAFAAYVNCEDRQPTDACGRCASCIKMRKLVHPDVYPVFPVASTPKLKGNTSEAFMPLWRDFVGQHPYRTLPEWLDFFGADNKQGNISAEEARNIVRKLSLKAYEGAYKVMIIWLPELMNVTSANALLKVLEEPPPQTLFLLATNAADKLLITILSRTQRVAVRAFTDDEVAMHLRQHLNLDEKRARQVAYLADGNLSEALQMVGDEPDRDRGLDRHAWFADWMRLCYRQDLIALVKQADQFDALTKEKQKGLMDYSLSLCRDLFLWKHQATPLLRLPEEERTFIDNFAKVLEVPHLERVIDGLNEASYHIERNARAKMVMLDLSLYVSRLIRGGK